MRKQKLPTTEMVNRHCADVTKKALELYWAIVENLNPESFTFDEIKAEFNMGNYMFEKRHHFSRRDLDLLVVAGLVKANPGEEKTFRIEKHLDNSSDSDDFGEESNPEDVYRPFG